MTVTAPTTSVQFGLAELDLLAEHAGVAFPFPLRIPEFGRITGERRILLAAAARTLSARGLADAQRPLGMAADVVTALREHRGTVDLVLTDEHGTVGAVAMVFRSYALLCVQWLSDDPTGTVTVHRAADTAVTGELLDLVPMHTAARSMPIALPGQVVAGAAAEVADDDERERLLRDLVRDNGGDPGVLDELAGLAARPVGRGQVGATRRVADAAVRCATELSWLDGPRGRVRLSRAADGWISVNPLRHSVLRGELDKLAALARRPR